jgi:hypothetical protein
MPMRSFSVFLSYLLHPVFTLTYVTTFFLFTENYFSFFMSPAKKIFLLSAVFIFSVVLPLLNITILKRLGYLKSVQMDQTSERFMPYVSSLVLHAGLLYILHDLEIPFFFKFIILASIAVLAVLFICNFFLRLSAHAAGWGGVLGIIAFYEYISFSPMLWPLCATILLAGLVCFARLHLQAHSARQVYTGFIAGFSASVLCLALMLYINYRF